MPFFIYFLILWLFGLLFNSLFTDFEVTFHANLSVFFVFFNGCAKLDGI